MPGFVATDAGGYDRLVGRWSFVLAEKLLQDVIAVSPGDQVLDVGCGTGSFSRAVLARLVDGKVSGIDPSQAYVAAANQRLGGARASFAVGDAAALPFGDNTFDVVSALLVMNFLSAPAEAAKEMLRVARAGGQVSAVCWDLDGGFVMTRMFWDTAAVLDTKAALLRGRALSAPMTRAGELASLFKAAGALDVEEKDLTIWMQFKNFADFWSTSDSGQGNQGGYVASLDGPAKKRLMEALEDAYLAGRPDGKRAFAATAHAVRCSA